MAGAEPHRGLDDQRGGVAGVRRRNVPGRGDEQVADPYGAQAGVRARRPAVVGDVDRVGSGAVGSQNADDGPARGVARSRREEIDAAFQGRGAAFVVGRGRVVAVPGRVVGVPGFVDGERVVVVEQGVEAGQERRGSGRQVDVERRPRAFARPGSYPKMSFTRLKKGRLSSPSPCSLGSKDRCGIIRSRSSIRVFCSRETDVGTATWTSM